MHKGLCDCGNVVECEPVEVNHDTDSQCAYILRVLSRGRTITASQALKGYGIARLGARIKNLREEGHDITTAMIPVTNRHGKQTRIAKYFMRSKRG